MSHPRLWSRRVIFAAGFGGGFTAAVATLFLWTRPADSGRVEPPISVTCRGVLAEPGFYAGRRVRLSTAGMTPGPDSHTLVYHRAFALPPALIARFTSPVPVPVPRQVVGRVEVAGTGPVVVADCRAD